MTRSSPVLIYLHGFRSSPAATKAQEIANYLQHKQYSIDYLCPLLPDTPDLAIPQLRALLQSLQGRKVSIIGSSLGGYYATWLAEAFDVRAVLVNPAVQPDKLRHLFMGLHENPYSGVQFEITDSHLDDLQSIYFPTILHPERYLVLMQTGDEVLDVLDASKKFHQSPCIVEHGGDHRFQGFERYLPHIMAWLEVE